MKLSAEEARIVGSLVEKEQTTPDQYPLTLKSLVAACNQASNRDPVVAYDEETVMEALQELKRQRLVRFVLPSHGRTAVRYRHVLDETLALDRRQCALLAVLLLRGPQTIGELRIRTDRMVDFEGLVEVEHELHFMSSVEEPLAASLGRRPGQKEERWICPLEAPSRAEYPPAPAADVGPEVIGAPAGDDGSQSDRGISSLRSELVSLRADVIALRSDLDALRSSLGG